VVASDRGIPSGGSVTMPDPGMPEGGDGGSGLAAFQAEVARLFFGLPKGKGFPRAGRVGLVSGIPTGRGHRYPK
jgi:hypothetical protein